VIVRYIVIFYLFRFPTMIKHAVSHFTVKQTS